MIRMLTHIQDYSLGFLERGNTGPAPLADDLFFGNEGPEELLKRLVAIRQARERDVPDRCDSAC